MKSKLKLLYVLLPLFPTLLSASSGSVANDSFVPDIEGDCESTADYIVNNLSELVYIYNHSEECTAQWNASYVEDIKPVISVSEEDSTYIYLDFNENNGWAVVGNDFDFLDFSPTGDLEYTKEIEKLLWSDYDGFVYLGENGYVKYGQEFLNEDTLLEHAFNYAGQFENFQSGSDGIKYVLSYLNDRYGSGWYLDSTNSKSLKGYTNVVQNDYAIYDRSEGNCTLSAYYGIFNYLRVYGKFNNLPSGTCSVDTSKDSFGSNHTVTNTTVPEIYAKIREAAMDYGYTTNSTTWTSACMARWGNDALEQMGYYHQWYNSYIYMYLTWSFQSQVVNNIKAGYPVMWNQARGNYADHSMVVKGYKTYKRKHKIWFITWYESKHFMLVNDNWADRDSYIDYDGYAFDLVNEGFGTFTVVRDYTW